MGVLTLNLLTKFLFFSEWSWKKSGIILTHLGTIILLLGGLVTSMTAKEGFIILPEGAPATPYIYDYNQRELYVFKGDKLTNRISFNNLKGTLDLNLPFKIKVLEKCENCRTSPYINPVSAAFSPPPENLEKKIEFEEEERRKASNKEFPLRVTSTMTMTRKTVARMSTKLALISII